MKLYFAPGACSLSPHIALQESGLPYTTEKVDLRSKKTASGADYLEVNPRGYVPALQLDNGQVLTEGPAIVQYIAHQAKDKQLVPAFGSDDHYHLLERLNFISAEIHKGFTPLFNPASTDEAKEQARANLTKRFGQAEKLLNGHDYLVGDKFSVADGYLFTILNWTKKVGPDLADMPNLQAFHARIGARPAVQQAMRDEGLLG
ncbi:glutathione transferase GstA [Massilia sp. R2A-15]|uniref:glutathione transferase GstA n=1 Tax=Massilia sp. R2A-15 TaxID=3064278 RepID=UPI002735B392|nr:glutathione transferase GstA [Massilia sp. R2A-15]WLI88362.1 glutathione transferase GstA [Massilia sp. R2A-15]